MNKKIEKFVVIIMIINLGMAVIYQILGDTQQAIYFLLWAIFFKIGMWD